MAVGQKRRNSDKRKEKSRDAARSRRGKESEIFSELAGQLPLHPCTVEQLDKASIMRLILGTLKIRSIMDKRPKQEKPDEDSMEERVDRMYSKALEGFMLVLSTDGDFIYMSEMVAKYLGLSQIDLIGQSVYEFVHPCDHDEVHNLLTPNHRQEQAEGKPVTIFIRMKCTLTSKGKSVNLKSATYKVIRLTGKFVDDQTGEIKEEAMEDSHLDDDNDDDDYNIDENDEDQMEIKKYKPRGLPHVVAIGETIPHPSNIEVPLDARTFTSRHNMNMKFTDCDDRIHHLIGYDSADMIGQSLYGFHHAVDSKMMEKAFKNLYSKGQVTTGQYRFMAKNGGYVWMVTQATVIYHSKTQKPQCVVCVHYVLSHVEQHGRILSNLQIAKVKKEVKPLMRIHCDIKQAIPKHPDVKDKSLLHVPIFSTEDVFSEKTEDMETDFYFPPGVKRTLDQSNELDLSHLAPQDGTVCIPLVPPSYNTVKHIESFGTSMNLYDDFADIEDGDFKSDLPFMINDGASSPSDSSIKSNVSSPYRVSAPPTPGDTMSTILQSGPPTPVTDAVNSHDTHLCPMEDIFTELHDQNEEIDFTKRAPFIPMSAEEDYTLVHPSEETLLNMGQDFNPGIFGSTESVFNLKDELYEGPPPEKKSKTAIEMIGGSTVKASIEQPHDMMINRMKRPLNRSCLEKGPPMKITKYGVVALEDSKRRSTEDNSVLMNLLLKGEDKNHGYSVYGSAPTRKENSGFLRSLLTRMTSTDIEVNAPSDGSYLLQGHDLVKALEMPKNRFNPRPCGGPRDA